MSKNIFIGKKGEEIAVEYLVSKGYKVLEKGYRSKRWGEIDIICNKDNRLIFVEVKTRTSNFYGRPEAAVTPHKIRSLKRAAMYYCITHPGCPKSLRMDVISILLSPEKEGAKEIDHYENAF